MFEERVPNNIVHRHFIVGSRNFFIVKPKHTTIYLTHVRICPENRQRFCIAHASRRAASQCSHFMTIITSRSLGSSLQDFSNLDTRQPGSFTFALKSASNNPTLRHFSYVLQKEIFYLGIAPVCWFLTGTTT